MPFCLPCADLICGSCLNIAKEIESYSCIECACCYTRTELEKIRSNKDLMKIMKIRKDIEDNYYYTEKNQIQTRIKFDNSICKSHNKSFLSNLYCFYHQKKICQDCLIEHQYSKCNLKIWSQEDSFKLLNEIKIRYAKINDIERNLEEDFINLENLLIQDDKSMDMDVFKEFVKVYGYLNKIEENRRNLIYNFLEDENFLKSSLELRVYMSLCEKLKEKTILTNPFCLRFITNNFQIGKDFHSVFHTVNNCHNLIISVYNNTNEIPTFYIKYHDDFYILENLLSLDGGQSTVDTLTKLKLIQTDLRFRKGLDETETVLLIDNKTYKYYDIFIFDNLLHIINNKLKGSCRFRDTIQVLYYNDKFFYFDFLNYIEINQNNYLKISFEKEEKISNLYLKLARFTSSLGEFVVDYMILDDPFTFQKILCKCKIKREFGGFFKTLLIERNLEIKENHIRIIVNNNEICAKVESISYFRITV